MSVTPTTNLQFFWRDACVGEEFRSGVSLHSHTMYSEESLEMVPRYTAQIPYLGAAIRRAQAEYTRKTGSEFDFRRALWTPPLTPRQAYRVEEKQIQRRFQLPALVSLTDHDDIRAGTLLRVLERYRNAPISTEWTVPFGPTFFHLGVHNIPPTPAANVMEAFRQFTAHPDEKELQGVLEMLNAHSDILVVLNHPLWDEKGIGLTNHAETLRRLISRFGHYLHALELNGLRSWTENKRVMELAREAQMPLVSGGDRHGREPNAILNLSRGTSLVEFIHEVRYGRFSHIVFMPQYHEPLKLRIVKTMVDVMRDYPERRDGRNSWMQRVFYRDANAESPVPFSAIWTNGGPNLVRHFASAMRVLSLL